jgi:hypothetical protein
MLESILKVILKPIRSPLLMLPLCFIIFGFEPRSSASVYKSERFQLESLLNLQQTSPVYKTYVNARYNYSISYPEGILIPQGEADNGDGQKFLSKDGRAELRVFGFQSLDGSLADAYQAAQLYRKEESARHVVTYKVLRKDWFVVSGLADGRIFYLKTFLKGPVFKSLVFEYDESQKAAFDPVTTRISHSFRG